MRYGKKGQMVFPMFLKILFALILLGLGITLAVLWHGKSGSIIDATPKILEGFS